MGRNDASESATRPRGMSGTALLLDGSSIGSTVIRQRSHDPFKSIWTGYISMIELAILVLYTVACFIDVLGLEATYHFEYTVFNNKISFYSLLHVFLWFLVLIFDRIVQHSHQKIRRRGYLKLYLRLRNIRRIPFTVYSFGIAFLLLIFTLERQLTSYLNDTAFSFDYLIVIVAGCEVIISSFALMYYILITLKFNCNKPIPDTIGNDSDMVVPFLSPPPDIGFSRDDETENVEELLDKQADMIRYLKAHNANLGRKIIELQNLRPQPQPET